MKQKRCLHCWQRLRRTVARAYACTVLRLRVMDDSQYITRYMLAKPPPRLI